MGDVSDNFSRHEFACKCGCGFDAADKQLIDVLEWLRAHLAKVLGSKVVISITSGNRCRRHNRNERGRPRSQHLRGIAADFKCYLSSGQQVDPDIVAAALEAQYPRRFGVGRYGNRTHLDVRAYKARWDER